MLAGIILYQFGLLFVITITALVLMKKTKEHFRQIAIVVIIFVFYFVMRTLPGLFNIQNFDMPWESRILSIVFSILCVFLFRKHFAEHNYFTIKQETKDLRKILLVSAITIIGYSIIFYMRGTPTVFNTEEFLFLSVFVEIEEELFFRGLLLGLLMSCLDEKIGIIKYPAVILCAVYFGLWHGNIYYYDYIGVITNCFYGYAAAWMAVKSRSLVIPFITHCLVNAIGYLITVLMI
jgi:membrane protease YdiL (CAAX protease family)